MTTTAGIETVSAEPRLAKWNLAVVCLNISESRTKNIIRELERRGFLAVEFQTEKGRSVLSELLSFMSTVRKADFVLCGGPLRSQIPWMLMAKTVRWIARSGRSRKPGIANGGCGSS